METNHEDGALGEEDLHVVVSTAAYTIIVAVLAMINLLSTSRNNISSEPSTYRRLHRNAHIRNFLYGTMDSCVAYVRMNASAFLNLAQMMRDNHYLRDTKHVTVEEQLAYFLNIIGHGQKNRIVRTAFYRSTRTVSVYVRRVLRAINSLKHWFIKQPSTSVHPKIAANRSWYPYFKDCIGFIDGTHVIAKVPMHLQPRFRGRKGITQNVLACCTPDMEFTYVLAGWEGSANDMTVLRDALSRPNGLKVPEGKFYLVDAGYATMPGFIAPYRSVRYHLNEIRDRRPENAKELFNFRHSSLRCTIERAFGMLKNRFKILDKSPHYSLPTQVDLVLACCLLHNYILGVDPDDVIVNDVHANEEDDYDDQNYSTQHNSQQLSQSQQRAANHEWVAMRDNIAQEMWNNFR